MLDSKDGSMRTETPAAPIAAVLAVVVRDREFVFVRRVHPPDAGLWGFPEGKIEGLGKL